LRFVPVPIKGEKRDQLHLINEELAGRLETYLCCRLSRIVYHGKAFRHLGRSEARRRSNRCAVFCQQPNHKSFRQGGESRELSCGAALTSRSSIIAIFQPLS
jgi:hypothetical protein